MGYKGNYVIGLIAISFSHPIRDRNHDAFILDQTTCRMSVSHIAQHQSEIISVALHNRKLWRVKCLISNKIFVYWIALEQERINTTPIDMFNRNSFALLITGVAMSAGAQTLSPTVISPAGDINHIEDISLEWTVGELAVSTFDAKDQMITEGFHQPMLTVERIVLPDANEDDLVIRIAPNPVKYSLQIEIADPHERILEFQLIDVQGRLVEHMKMSAYTQNIEFDMSQYASGFYVLRVIDLASQSMLDAYKIAKID